MLIRKEFKQKEECEDNLDSLRVLLIRKEFKRIFDDEAELLGLRVLLIRKEGIQTTY